MYNALYMTFWRSKTVRTGNRSVFPGAAGWRRDMVQEMVTGELWDSEQNCSKSPLWYWLQNCMFSKTHRTEH